MLPIGSENFDPFAKNPASNGGQAPQSAGAVQLAIVWSDKESKERISVTGNVVIFPAKTPKGNFVALANIFYDLHMFIREASCSPVISDSLRPEVEKIRAELEASNVKE